MLCKADQWFSNRMNNIPRKYGLVCVVLVQPFISADTSNKFGLSLFFCQLTCQYSALLAYTFTSVCTTACPKLQSPETCCLFLKIPHLLRMKNCSRHADLFIRQFARAITSKVPPPKV